MSIAARKIGGGEKAAPYNLEAEESLLGAMLLSKDAIADAIEICQSTDFYKPSHQHIFDALVAAWNRGDPADTVTIADELKRKDRLDEVGGLSKLMALQAGCPAISSAANYARIVTDMADLRRSIAVATDIAERAYGLPEDVEDHLDLAEQQVFELRRRQGEAVQPVAAGLDAMLQRLDELANPGGINGLATGFRDLDGILSGIKGSNLVIVGARPGMGKTAFGLNVAASVGMKQNLPVLLFSLEMSCEEVIERLAISEAKIDSARMRNGKLLEKDWDNLPEAVKRLSSAPIYIDDNPNVTVMEIRARARRVKAREGLSLIVVDYLQLMSSGRGRSENRQVEISEISRSLKILARELEVPVIALSQLSRNLEMRTDKRPMLSDLRESGALEQDADVVLFIYRDEVYNPDSADRGIAEIIVAKHRSGPTGVASLAWISSWMKFADLAKS